MKRLFWLLILGFTITLLGVPRVGEQYTYKVKVVVNLGKEKPLTSEFTLIQKIKKVNKDQSFIVEITPKFEQSPAGPTQKQPLQQQQPISLQIFKDGKAKFLTNTQNPMLANIPGETLPALAGILPLPSNFSKEKTIKIPMSNNPNSYITFKNLGQANFKGKKCYKVSMTIPKSIFSHSTPQSEMKMTTQGEGMFYVLPTDNRILEGKIIMSFETKGYTYNQQKQKISLDSKGNVNVEISKIQ
ncbi:hypothetical protein H5T87_03335 [bacterium]|nr:hypothetical protein [bacterium]